MDQKVKSDPQPAWQPGTTTLSKATSAKIGTSRTLSTADRLGKVLKWSHHDFETGRYRQMLYRFMTDHIPAINACVWTWVRLAAAPGKFRIVDPSSSRVAEQATARLDELAERLYTNPTGNRIGLDSLLPELYSSLYRDGIFAGFVTVRPEGGGVDQFLPVDPINLRFEQDGRRQGMVLELDSGSLEVNRPDFYYLPFNASVSQPFGRSILQAVPFVSYVEQQLVDDMRRSSHNSGFHRLHVKIEPPDRQGGESDNAYNDRINEYFDSTVGMIKSLEIEDNPVTWDNVKIEHIAPGRARDVTSSWFLSHRGMVEEICAGTHLAPYLLGYSYGATTTWAGFKFDVVMRQVRSVQAQVSNFLEWLTGIDLALAGIDARCRYEFDNSFTYLAKDEVSVETSRVDNVVKLYQAGLIDQAQAREKICHLI